MQDQISTELLDYSFENGGIWVTCRLTLLCNERCREKKRVKLYGLVSVSGSSRPTFFADISTYLTFDELRELADHLDDFDQIFENWEIGAVHLEVNEDAEGVCSLKFMGWPIKANAELGFDIYLVQEEGKAMAKTIRDFLGLVCPGVKATRLPTAKSPVPRKKKPERKEA